MTADSRPTERAMKAAVEMEMHATVGTTTVAKGETLDKCFPAYDELLEALKHVCEFIDREGPAAKEWEAISDWCEKGSAAIAKAEGRS